jgi:hypothetical protein
MGEIIHGRLDLIILFEISSYPLEFLFFNDLIIFFNLACGGILPLHLSKGHPYVRTETETRQPCLVFLL